MNVSQILDTVISFGVRSDLIADGEKEKYLQYLNDAHAELYNETATLNNSLETLISANVTDGYTSLLETPHSILKVVDTTTSNILEQTTFSTLIDAYPLIDEEGTETGTPLYYVWKSNKIYIVPFEETIINLTCIPSYKPFTLDTEEADIPYPISYHQVLVWGALKYLYSDIDESSLKDNARIVNALKQWQDGISKLRAKLQIDSGVLRTQYQDV